MMKLHSTAAFLLLFGLAFGGPALAQSTDATPNPATDAPAVPVSATAKTVPSLDIRWNCGDCAHNDKIIPLIQERYASEAQAAGYTISADDTVATEIVDFRQRPPGVRVMFGVMSGKDRLRLKAVRDGQEYFVGDTSANAIQGQNALCAEAGKQLFRVMTGQPAKR